MSDQVSGRYQGLNPWYNVLGQTANAVQSDVPTRSNIEIFGPVKEETGTITSEKGLLAAIPVTYGDSISNVRIGVVATEAETSSEFIGAIYPGLAAGKKTKVAAESAVIKEQAKKEKGFVMALKESLLITPTNAPFGFVYAGFFVKETTPALKVGAWKSEAKFQMSSTTVKVPLGAFWALTEAATGSFASAKEEFEVKSGAVSTEVPWIILT